VTAGAVGGVERAGPDLGLILGLVFGIIGFVLLCWFIYC